MSFWEVKLCDCGSVNNKLFKNIYSGFGAFMGMRNKTHLICVGCSHCEVVSAPGCLSHCLMHESQLLTRPISVALLADVVFACGCGVQANGGRASVPGRRDLNEKGRLASANHA